MASRWPQRLCARERTALQAGYLATVQEALSGNRWRHLVFLMPWCGASRAKQASQSQAPSFRNRPPSLGPPLIPSVRRQLRFDHIRHQAMLVSQEPHHFE